MENDKSTLQGSECDISMENDKSALQGPECDVSMENDESTLQDPECDVSMKNDESTLQDPECDISMENDKSTLQDPECDVSMENDESTLQGPEFDNSMENRSQPVHDDIDINAEFSLNMWSLSFPSPVLDLAACRTVNRPEDRVGPERRYVPSMPLLKNSPQGSANRYEVRRKPFLEDTMTLSAGMARAGRELGFSSTASQEQLQKSDVSENLGRNAISSPPGNDRRLSRDDKEEVTGSSYASTAETIREVEVEEEDTYSRPESRGTAESTTDASHTLSESSHLDDDFPRQQRAAIRETVANNLASAIDVFNRDSDALILARRNYEGSKVRLRVAIALYNHHLLEGEGSSIRDFSQKIAMEEQRLELCGRRLIEAYKAQQVTKRGEMHELVRLDTCLEQIEMDDYEVEDDEKDEDYVD